MALRMEYREVTKTAAKPTKEYEVGYGKPPKEHQFKKGQSGNRKGRPKGRSDYLADLRRALSQKVEVTENGKRKRISMWELLIRQLLSNAAAKADPRLMDIAIKLLLLLPDETNDKGTFTLVIEGA